MIEWRSRDLFVLLFEAMKGRINQFLSADMVVLELKLGLRYGQTGSGKTYTMRCSAEGWGDDELPSLDEVNLCCISKEWGRKVSAQESVSDWKSVAFLERAVQKVHSFPTKVLSTNKLRRIFSQALMDVLSQCLGPQEGSCVGGVVALEHCLCDVSLRF